MSTIRIEWSPITRFALGWFGLDHLQLTFDPSVSPGTDPQDSWYVLEGILSPGAMGPVLGVFGDNGHTSLSAANGGKVGAELAVEIGTPLTRGSRILPVDRQVLGSWDTMANYGEGINGAGFQYYAFNFDRTVFPTQNSSSVISSLLWQIGLDANLYRPYGIRISPGLSTYLGTELDDTLRLPTINFNTLSGGAGADTLYGSDIINQTDKLYGGQGNDTILWSPGFNVINGGDPRTPGLKDGFDVLNYAGAGEIKIDLYPYRIANLTPDLTSSFTGTGNRGSGTDWLSSIDEYLYSGKTDRLEAGEGLTAVHRNVSFELGGDEGGEGDAFDLDLLPGGVTITQVDDTEFKLEIGDTGTSKAWWIRSAESIEATEHDDLLYLPSSVLIVDGNGGNDRIDARKVTAGGRASPGGFDIEIDGGNGEDLIVSGSGRTLARGGAGRDVFVLSAYSLPAGTSELVIADGSAEDSLFVPYVFFDGDLGDLAASPLMQVLGGADPVGDAGDEDRGYFIWQTQDQQVNNPDPTDGLIRFAGDMYFTMDGSDLVIEIVPGLIVPVDLPINDAGDILSTFTSELLFDSRAFVRVIDFDDGDLGITFETVQYAEFDQVTGEYGAVSQSDNWDAIAQRLTADGQMAAALGELPTAASQPDEQSAEPELAIVLTGSADVHETDSTVAMAVDAGAGDDRVATGSGNDVIDGGSGDDILSARAGDDVIDGGTGDDIMGGGAGDDVYLVGEAGDVVIEFEREGMDSVEAEISYTLTDFVETLTLKGSAGTGTGNGLDNTLQGHAGDNMLRGLGGSDTLYGGGGQDLLDGGAGADGYVYFTDEGHITIRDTGAAGDSDVLALPGETDASGMRAYRLAAAPDDLVLDFPAGGSVTIEGFMSGHGIERITFREGVDLTRADLLALDPPVLASPPPRAIADDAIFLSGSTVTVPAAAFLYNDIGESALRIVALGAPSLGSATITPAGDIDVVVPSGFIGEVGFDYTVEDSAGLRASARATISVMAREVAPSVVISIGTAAADTLAGTGADDLFVPGAGDDVVSGGDGRDTVDYSGASGAVRVLLDGGTAREFTGATTGSAVASIDQLQAIEDIVGSSFGDELTGSAVANDIAGGDGNDVINGGAGADRMAGGAGNDTFTVDAIGDVLVEGEGGGRDVAYVTVDRYVLAPGQHVDELKVWDPASVGHTLTGNELANNLAGRAGNDTLIGGGGNDLLNGQAGTDTVAGGTGNDIMFVDNAGDVVIEAAGEGTDAVYATTSYALAAGQSIETLLSWYAEGVTLVGNEFANTINGHTGAETLDGGLGNDRLTGRAGADTFRFDDNWGADWVTDFENDIDTLDFSMVDGIDGYGDLVISQAGLNTVIRYGSQTVTLANVTSTVLEDDILL